MFNLIFKIERYKWNKEYGVYVSNLGHFKDRYKRLIPHKINNKGYVTIETEKGRKSAHRLVMLTWKKIPNAEDMTVDHLDNNKRNNELSNLEWVTQEENQARATNVLLTDEPAQGRILIGTIAKTNVRFKNLQEAAKFVMALNNIQGMDIGAVASKINKKAKTNQKYCRVKFSYID